MAQRNTFRDDEDLEEKINMRDLARVGVYLKPYMARVVWILIVVAAMGCINVVEPYLTKIMIDSVIPAKNLALLGELVALLAVLIVIYEFGLRYRTVEITRVGQLMLKDMRRDLFTHIQTLPFSYFDSRPHGKILIRVVNYVNTLSDTLSSGLVNVISDPRNIWSSSMLNDPPPRIVLPPLLCPVMKQVYIRLLTSSFSNIADRISLQPVGHTSMRAIMEYPQPPALTFIASESIHNSLTPNACAQYVRRRLLTATATPAPPTSSATTVNSTVPAAPVSGS